MTAKQQASKPSRKYIHWLEGQSMLFQAEELSEKVSGQSVQWRKAYARPRSHDFVKAGSVWFTNYPKSMITSPGKSIVETLGSERLLALFNNIGIKGIHTSPMKRAGGIKGYNYTPSIDGFFDRIELEIDPRFGTDEQYMQMSCTAKEYDMIIIGDLVPAHTGKGADFRLAERAYKNYEGLYTMVEIPQADWELLGPVPEGADSVNLPLKIAQILEDKGYIPGPLEVVPFCDPGIKDSCWSATDEVIGFDGVKRRWVYLHVFKDGQPSFNWLDPTFGAQRIVMADAVQSLQELGATGLRLDACPLIGIEGRAGREKSWIEGHPLAEGGSNAIAMMIRKLGGYSFQELNQELDILKRFTTWGADLSYDFFTRPPYLYALATGDAGPLRMIYQVMEKEEINPGTLVHALQNHDELMFDLSHLHQHGDETFAVNGEEVSGNALYERMYREAKEKVIGNGFQYIREFSNRGFCTTMVGYACAILGIPNPDDMTAAQTSAVQQLHLLAATFNAMQPGVFALSGWDLVGALPVLPHELGKLLQDRDYRWMNRGAFDLLGVPKATAPHLDVSEVETIPKAKALYGPLPEQLRDPNSFVSQLRRMLQAREANKVALSKRVEVPEVDRHSVIVMVCKHPDNHDRIITALNFAQEPVHTTVQLPSLAERSAYLIFCTQDEKVKNLEITKDGNLSIDLHGLHGQVFVVCHKEP